MIRGAFILLLIVLFSELCQAQVDTIQIHEVQISSSILLNKTVGLDNTSPDTLFKEKNEGVPLGSILSNMGLHIRNSGPDALNSISIRGRGTNHTAIHWNGFSINAPTLGTIDLNTISLSEGQVVDVYRSGVSSFAGSSAIGGLIDMYSPISFDGNKYVNASFSASSTDNFQYRLSHKITDAKFCFSGSIDIKNHSNNFAFKNEAKKEKPIEIISHAGFVSTSIQQQVAYKFSNNNRVEAGMWYQRSSKEIPPLMTTIQSQAVQKDSLWRSYLSYIGVWKGSEVRAGIAYFDEYQFYTDLPKKIQAKYRYKTLSLITEWKRWVSKKTALKYTMNVSQYSVESESFDECVIDWNGGASFSIQHIFSDKVKANLSVREDILNSSWAPFSPLLGMEWRINTKCLLMSNTGYNYKFPGMNDKYWKPGGNPDLLSETSWNNELIFKYEYKGDFSFGYSLAVYNAMIDNWIEWQPGPEQYYKAYNLKKVNTYGSDISFFAMKSFESSLLRVTQRYSYVKSENEETYLQSQTSTLDQQLIYTPIHYFQSEFTIQLKNWLSVFTYSFIGEQNVSADGSFALRAYAVFDTYVERKILFSPISITAKLQLNNITNQSYQSTAWQAMPLFNYSFNVKISYTLKNNKPNEKNI